MARMREMTGNNKMKCPKGNQLEKQSFISRCSNILGNSMVW